MKAPPAPPFLGVQHPSQHPSTSILMTLSLIELCQHYVVDRYLENQTDQEETSQAIGIIEE